MTRSAQSRAEAAGGVTSEAERARALGLLPDGVFLLSPVCSGDGAVEDLQFRYLNEAACSLYRRSAEEVVGRTVREVLPPAAGAVIADHCAQVLAAGSPDQLEMANFDESGVVGAFLLDLIPVDADVLVITRDVAGVRSAEASRDRQAEQLRAIVDNSADGIARYGPDLRLEFVNRRAEEISGIPAEAWVGRTHLDLGYPPELARLWDNRIATVFSTGEALFYTYDVVTAAGQTWWEASLAPEFGPDGSVAHVVSVNREVTERVRAEQRLAELASEDPLTGLANRTGLASELARAVKSGRRSGRQVAVLMLDLDGFKLINDSRGHAVGDRLLVAVSNRLQALARGDDLIARLGGDEFVIVMRDLAEPQDAAAAAWRLVEALREPTDTPDGAFFITASVGVAVGDGAADGDELIRNADAAMYAAKSAGRDQIATFSDDLHVALTARLEMEQQLRRALERDELMVWYQPEVDLATGRVTAAEALLRWDHPSGKVLTADLFVGIAEETGLIRAIGSWVFEQACQQAARWARDPEPVVVRVNLSAVQLKEIDLLATIDDVVARSGVAASQICVEITETAWLDQSASVLANLQGIRDRGISLAIDDFGTGYASITYLREYPVSVLKIDRSFIANIATDARDERLVSGLISLARAVDITVTAEGVETEEQAQMLRRLGCPSSQGFLYSPAVPPEQFEALLATTFASG